MVAFKSSDIAEQPPLLLWFRDDLRLLDNPALVAAAETGLRVIPVFIHDDESPSLRRMGDACRWWLHESLASLQNHIESCGGQLLIRTGKTADVLRALVIETGAKTAHWNRRYGEAERTLDSTIMATLKADGVSVKSFNAHLLHEPWEVTSKVGTPMKVFTPFWRAARERGEPDAPLPLPSTIRFLPPQDVENLNSQSLASLALQPVSPNWAHEMQTSWTPGEKGAASRLHTFLEANARNYAEDRNRPDKTSTSRLSPHLRFGEISPRQIWHATKLALEAGETTASGHDLDKFLSEIGWREFSYHLLYHFPKLASENFQKRFDAFPWMSHAAHLKAWQTGMTGYPIVDAGMRELWRTGWMHNRVRMMAASFLIKHLMIDWRVGEEWFWDTLVDADPAANSASWQWVAGSGADAAPYFRIFAPVLQGEKFDPNGDYVRKYVPELAKLPNAFIHKPWLAPHPVLAAAGIRLGVDYPAPVVDHIAARDRALAAFQSLSSDQNV